MQCGPVRHRVDAKSAAASRPFQHSVHVRPTSFRPVAVADLDKRIQFQDLNRELIADEDRNRIICEQVIQSVREGRSPLVLTERKEHLTALATRLESHVQHIVVLHGGLGPGKTRAVADRLAAIPDDEGRVLLATGATSVRGLTILAWTCCFDAAGFVAGHDRPVRRANASAA